MSGYGTVAGAITDGGLIDAAGGQLTLAGAVSGPGMLRIESKATVYLQSSDTAPIAFASASGTLLPDQPGAVTGAITGFVRGDRISLRGIVATSDSYADGVLTLFNGSTRIAALSIAGNFTGQVFTLASDGNGGTDVTLAANAAPVIAVPAAQKTVLAANLALSGVSLADPDAAMATQSETVTVLATLGKLNAAPTGQGDIVTGTNTGKLVITGTLAQVNADLATLTYRASKLGSDTIRISAIDSAGAAARQATIAVTVSSSATPPAGSPLLLAQLVAAHAGDDRPLHIERNWAEGWGGHTSFLAAARVSAAG